MPIFRAWISERNRGFTLLELLVVLLLLSIFVSFASVNWIALGKSGKEDLLEKFSIEVSLLREDAVSNYETRIMEFDVPNSRIRVGWVDQKRGFVETREILMPRDYTIKDAVINGVPFSIGKGSMNFYANGMVDRVVLHLNRENDFYSLLVNPLTAKVTGENGYVEELSIKGRNNPS